MYAEEYMKRCDQALERIKREQTGNIVKAAEMMADSTDKGGVLHFASFMHMPGEPISRAGGLFLIRPIARFDLGAGEHTLPSAGSRCQRMPWRRFRGWR